MRRFFTVSLFVAPAFAPERSARTVALPPAQSLE
jgi:hypothetical protein